MSGLLAWLGKCVQVRVSLKKEEANGMPHPLYAEAVKWLLITLEFTTILALFLVSIILWRIPSYVTAILPPSVMIGFMLLRFWVIRGKQKSRFERYEYKIKRRMEKYLRQRGKIIKATDRS